MDKLQQIRIFVAVVDCNGFAGAARKLRISPPVVTRAINELENELDVRLLTRTTRVVLVTEPGDRYVEADSTGGCNGLVKSFSGCCVV
jgi:DNA-binding transcriptional LysR family regulator